MAVDLRTELEARIGIDLQTPGVARVQEPANAHPDRRARRSILRGGPALARRGQVEEPHRKLAEMVVRPRHHAGTHRIGGAPIGAEIPCVRRAGGVLGQRPRRVEAHAPSVVDEQRGAACLPHQEQHDACARERGAQKLWMEHPQRRQDGADDNGFGGPIEGHAVERSADAVGPEQSDCREHRP
jgi:hypothetical protein